MVPLSTWGDDTRETELPAAASIRPKHETEAGVMCTFDVKAAGTVTDGDMVGREGSEGGAWTAYGYGTAAKNPSGIVGTSNAPFDDGGAASTCHAEAE